MSESRCYHPSVLRLSSVAFFNSAPLVYGLDVDPGITLRFGVPSVLIDDLVNDDADVALLPIIDYQRARGLRIIPATGIGCDGPTLTVRLFSRTPIEHTRVLAADTDSHTSVILARLLLQLRYGIRPELITLPQATDSPGETRLLIGDKVITQEPDGFPYQLDLGEAWKVQTGLPFVFAVWTARPNVAVGDLGERLKRALAGGLANVESLIEAKAMTRGWPREIARQYLTEYLNFTIGDRQIEAIRHFHQLAHQHGFLDAELQPLRFA